MTKTEIIASLGLEMHPTEGGYFKRTYASVRTVDGLKSTRKLMTSIYYLLTDDQPQGCLHKNKSDIIHYHHFGAPILYTIITADGCLTETILGSNITKGETPQLVVKAGDWKVSQLYSGEYGLISEAVTPGFEYDDNEIATREIVRRLFPELAVRLDGFIKCY